jgi:predicted type IV restriction endonuclease
MVRISMAYFLFNFTKSGAKKDKTLRDQAAALMNMELWGIGEKTPNKDHLAPGDRVLVYVGAPEQEFIGHATLAKGVHHWDPSEAALYPEDQWPSGVAFSNATIWDQPVSLNEVWPQMPSSSSNPEAHFFAGVMQIKQKDFEVVLAERGETEMSAGPAVESTPSSLAPPAADTMIDRLFGVGEKLRQFLATGQQIGEDATRAMFIDKWIEALGYTEFGEVEYGVQVESKDFADYVLSASGDRALVVEAKKLGSPLGTEQAAQVIKYASVIGLRWGLVTDGRHLQLYDRLPNLPPADRLVFQVDLGEYSDREDFEVRIYPELALLAKSAMKDGEGLERRAAQEAVRDLLTDPSSAAVQSLKEELATAKLAQMSEEEVAALLGEALG